MQVSYTPTWKEHEEGLSSDNFKESMKAAEAFDTTRRKEMKISKKARDWEKGRKADIARQKPAWVKEQENKTKVETDKMVRDIKDFGTINANLRPYRGFILIKTIENTIQKTSSGLYLPDSDKEDNVAEVIAVGEPLWLDSKTRVEAGVIPGHRVLLKKFAGIDVETAQGKCKLIQFSDVLGILE